MQSTETSFDYVARDFINPPIMISKNMMMVDVIEKLTELNISRLIIHDAGKPIGIITTKDWINLFHKAQNSFKIHNILLTDIMHKIVYVDPMTPIETCAKIILAKRLSSLGVKNSGHIEGIFTKTDLVRFYSTHYDNETKVSEYMTKDVVTGTPDEPLYKIIQRMIENIVPRIIIKSDDKLKILTMGDFFRVTFGLGNTINAEEQAERLEKIRQKLNVDLSIGGNTSVKDILPKGSMITVNSSDSLVSACKIMLENHIDAVGVVNEKKNLCGILSKTDIVCAILNKEKIQHSIPKKSGDLTKPNSLNVLIVDDSKFSRVIYEDIFHQRGHIVDTAMNGSECLLKYQFKIIENSSSYDEPPYDVVILDYEMPGMKGNELAQQILKINSKQKICIISSWEIQKLQEEFSSLADYVEIIEKGTPFEVILSELEAYNEKIVQNEPISH